ncbi:hypothetical protein CH359_19100 [Leptospira meyeri]|nr:hypothetical protein CH359_19100 [Leptospira meyeri]PJZ95114.1 hypothetical protein CH358_19060 [Leptospira meyeri]
MFTQNIVRFKKEENTVIRNSINKLFIFIFCYASINCNKPLFTDSILENKDLEFKYLDLKSVIPFKYDDIYLQVDPGPFSTNISTLIPNLDLFYKENGSVNGNFINPLSQMFNRTQFIFTFNRQAIYLESINRNYRNAIEFNTNCLVKIKGNEKPYENVEPALAIDFYKVKHNVKFKRILKNEKYTLLCK